MSKNHWSAYWDTGVLTSLPSDFKENYDGELFEYWESVLTAGQPSQRILDLCTGNGAVAILLATIAQKHALKTELFAVDASDINPKNVVKAFPEKSNQIHSIQFIGNCLVEDMSESIDGEFDLIVSQYGIEYCDTERAAHSVYQKLKAGGRFVFVAHSPNTSILQYMRVEQQVFDHLNSLSVFDTFARFSKNKLSSNSFKNKLENSLHNMSQQHQLRSQNLFNIWGQTMYQLSQMKNAVLEQQRVKVGEFAQLHLFAMKRAQDMLDVSDKLINDKNWYQPFEQVGLILQNHGELKYQGKHNVGHFYEFKKPELIV